MKTSLKLVVIAMLLMLGAEAKEMSREYVGSDINTSDVAAFIGLRAWIWRVSDVPANTTKITVQILRGDKILGTVSSRPDSKGTVIKLLYSTHTGQCILAVGVCSMAITGAEFENVMALQEPISADGKEIVITQFNQGDIPPTKANYKNFRDSIAFRFRCE